MPSNFAPSLSLLCFIIFNCPGILFPPSVSRWNNLNFGLDSDLEVTNPNRYYFIAYFIITQFILLLYQGLSAQKLITVHTYKLTKCQTLEDYTGPQYTPSNSNRTTSTSSSTLTEICIDSKLSRANKIFKILHFSLGVTNLHKNTPSKELSMMITQLCKLIKATLS